MSTYEVDVLKYNNVLQLTKLNFNYTSRHIAGDIQRHPPRFFTLFRCFRVNSYILEQYNMFYSEKQIKGVNINFPDYYFGQRLCLHTSIITPPRRLPRLIRKFFSGDLSGVIGESIIAYFLIEELGIERDKILHLRPDKRRGVYTPDFYVYDDDGHLRTLLGGFHKRSVFIEVKSSVGFPDDERIKKGLLQLKRTMMPQASCGLLSLVVRNSFIPKYMIYMIGVTA